MSKGKLLTEEDKTKLNCYEKTCTTNLVSMTKKAFKTTTLNSEP